jgi:uncharacterized repeat protein (TIGR03803 family)
MAVYARLFGISLGLAALAASPAAQATTFTTLYSFSGVGVAPLGGLVLDAKGALYGTTAGANHGIVFKFDPATNTRTTLHAFAGPDGSGPYAGLVFDKSGALYGTTLAGGTNNIGTVFKLTPPPVGKTVWIEAVLHSFTGGADGANPMAGLVFGPDGALYGTTTYGGLGKRGTVFRLDPTNQTLTPLHTFFGTDGAYPEGALVFDKSGALYGTTSHGGPNLNVDVGTVFKLAPVTYALTTLYAFSGAAGGGPIDGLVFDAEGNLYGTAPSGGVGHGTVFELNPVTKGFKVLQDFTGSDGDVPTSGLVFDAVNNLFGTTQQGGVDGRGTVFKLNPTTRVLTPLHVFTGADGALPYAGLVFGPTGALFGTTRQGGTHNGGTIFKLVP